MANHTTVMVGTHRSRDLVNGVAATLRRLERDALGGGEAGEVTPEGARRRLDTFQRSLARALQQAHLETVQELTSG
jgi:hypothetical protein